MPESSPNLSMKMSGHLTDAQIDAFRQSSFAGELLLCVSDHLAVCNFCRERSIPNSVLSLKIAHLQEDFERHLTDEELMAWVDAQPVAEPGFVQAHLGRCASCRSELADLHAFQARLKPPVRSRAPFRWVALAAAIIILAMLVARKPSVPGPLPVASAPPAPAAPAPYVVERAPILDELYRPEGKLLGKTPQAALRALSPVGIVTASDRPVFRWEEVPGAAAYVVSVYAGNFKKVAESSKLSANMWQPQEPLTRGMRLSWQVSARVGDKDELLPSPPAREAVFQVMNSEDAAEIERARDVDHASPVMLGLLYTRAGALEDAEAEFRKAPEAADLLRSVTALLEKQR